MRVERELKPSLGLEGRERTMWEEQRNFVNERGLEQRKLIIQDKRGTKTISMKKIETGSFKRKTEGRRYWGTRKKRLCML